MFGITLSSVIGYQLVSTSWDLWVGLAGVCLGRPYGPLKPIHGQSNSISWWSVQNRWEMR